MFSGPKVDSFLKPAFGGFEKPKGIFGNLYREEASPAKTPVSIFGAKSLDIPKPNLSLFLSPSKKTVVEETNPIISMLKGTQAPLQAPVTSPQPLV
jgi:hypothetical protein